MHHLVALFAGCLLYPPVDDPCRIERAAQYEFLRNHPAAKIEWSDNGTIRRLKDPKGIVLPTGIAGFKVGEPARELLEVIGPLVLARGTEELRVYSISPAHRPEKGTAIHLREFIRGREVVQGLMSIVLDHETNEVTLLSSAFLPDRGLDHEPRLTAADARVELEAQLREVPYQDMNPRFQDQPARLAYSFEQWGSYGELGGALVWVFSVEFPPAGGELHFGELNVNAVTGKITPYPNVLYYWERQ